MIVTFHLAAYFVYYIWNNYLSVYSNQSTSNNNERSNDNNRTNPTLHSGNDQPHNETSTRTDTVNDSEIPTSGNTNNFSEDPNTKTGNMQAKEGEGDIHPCLHQSLFEDEDALSLIYNVEPTYDCNYDAAKGFIQFIPPVYIQRYVTIERILKLPRWINIIKKVVNFGCAEISFEVKYLKKIFEIEEIVSVDIDSQTLEDSCCKIAPNHTDYMLMRPAPLKMRVFCGSVAHTHESLMGADAVIAIELIEHLFPPELESLPFTIFGFIKPKIAIFTTPNADFNVFFTKLSGFRHIDHKFEWTRQQFEDWGNNLVLQYPDYQVTFQGIGPGPENSDKYGCCSQMATFVRVHECPPIPEEDLHVQDGVYTLIKESDIPYHKETRTDDEKVRDSAVGFITNCKLLSRAYDDEMVTEIKMQAVMERIKYCNKEKLKEILIAANWDVKTNSNGEEVVVIPDSEEEESLGSDTELDADYNVHEGINEMTEGSQVFEENWDWKGDANKDMTFTSDSCNDQTCPASDVSGCVSCLIDESYLNLNPVNYNTENVGSTDYLSFSCNKNCSIPETPVPEVRSCDQINSSLIESVSKKGKNLEKSIYETPYNNGLKPDRYSCDRSPSPSLSDQDRMFKTCKRALAVESPDHDVNSQNEDLFCCLSTVPSSCDNSIYATPCCSQFHKKNIPKCLSLQEINSHSSSHLFSTELDETLMDGDLDVEHKDKFSKSVEAFKSLDSDLTYSSASRVVDSGYPDSCSEYNMDMDLTPEQFDDIETESEGNDASSRSLSPPPPPPQIPWLIDDVQNGDVANNNRDGEGNNLVADMEEEPLEFEARIDEINNEIPNMAGADYELNLSCHLKSGERDQEEICGDHISPVIPDSLPLSDVANEQTYSPEKLPTSDLKSKSVFTEKNTETYLTDELEKLSIRSTKSDSSIMTNYSWISDSVESQTHCDSEGLIKSHKKQDLTNLRAHNSLTTVLNGCSKFSNCSLVRPVDLFQVSVQEKNSKDELLKSEPSGSREHTESTSNAGITQTASLTCTQPQEDQFDVKSVYQSAESLNSCEPQIENDIGGSSFPEWLLNILLSDSEESEVESVDSLQSVWSSDSLDELVGLNFDVEFDVRGGGDPQRDSWH